ncbi:putative 4Fe-4S binding domain [Prochlorococcus sp. MIT 0702]|nr:putative 4Fe-4S binding domain [Prochlorococcus sp. MIT 0701]KGG29730.1 putative 4Fe-4S binding domain [Prochlorococcus sp. MIT 0702]KGG34285.1 putative 4Fe-4S binding domain [Prochlorococcus sp. MIT 0703]
MGFAPLIGLKTNISVSLHTETQPISKQSRNGSSLKHRHSQETLLDQTFGLQALNRRQANKSRRKPCKASLSCVDHFSQCSMMTAYTGVLLLEMMLKYSSLGLKMSY